MSRFVSLCVSLAEPESSAQVSTEGLLPHPACIGFGVREQRSSGRICQGQFSDGEGHPPLLVLWQGLDISTCRFSQPGFRGERIRLCAALSFRENLCGKLCGLSHQSHPKASHSAVFPAGVDLVVLFEPPFPEDSITTVENSLGIPLYTMSQGARFLPATLSGFGIFSLVS